jgi:uncharacterized membrane protein
MTDLFLASVFLPLSHFGLSSSPLRATLVGKLGEQRFLTLYKVITLAAFAWLIASYCNAPSLIIWTPPAAIQLAALPVVMLSFVLVVAGITTPNPTVVGAQRLFAEPEIVRGILRVTRNAFLWGIGLWAVAHAICTGDFASALMFGSIGTLGLAGAPVLDAKKRETPRRRVDSIRPRHLECTFPGDPARAAASVAAARDRMVANCIEYIAVFSGSIRP